MSQEHSTLVVSIFSPVNAPIGWYTLSIQISARGSDPMLKLGTFMLLFNPWLQGRHLTAHSLSHHLITGHGKEVQGVLFRGSGLIRKSLWDVEKALKLEVGSHGFESQLCHLTS